jgi:hypothetical protein
MRCRCLFSLASAVAVAALSLLAAGCGGNGGSSGVASVASTTTPATTTPQNGLLAFSSCMRSNGMPNFPDPQHFVGGNVKLTIHQFGANNPQFQAAINACNQLLPTNGGSGSQETVQQQRTQRADALSFARCVRNHGVARFPDPTAQGELTVASVQTCLPASHGLLTPAKVRAALAGH